MICGQKKAGFAPALLESVFSGLGETGREGEGGLGILYVAECFAHHLLGDAGAFAALGGHAGGLADLTVTAATIVDGIANLTVGDALAKTDVHKHCSL